MDASSRYSTPCGPLCHNRTTVLTCLVAQIARHAKYTNVAKRFVRAAVVFTGAVQFGQAAYAVFDWLHAIHVLY